MGEEKEEERIGILTIKVPNLVSYSINQLDHFHAEPETVVGAVSAAASSASLASSRAAMAVCLMRLAWERAVAP